MGRNPLLVDLDVSQNILSVPGTISTSFMTWDSISVATHAAAGNSITTSKTPLVFWYGSTDPGFNPDLYKMQLDTLARAIDARLSASVAANVRASGIIVNTSCWIEDTGYQMLLHAAEVLKIDVILVMGDDRLYSMLQSHFSNKTVSGTGEVITTPTAPISFRNTPPKVVKLPRSGGVVSRDPSFRRLSRNLCIRRYFNGDWIRTNNGESMTNQYTPSLLELPFLDLVIYKMSKVSLTASMLPVSAKQTTDPLQLTEVELGPSLMHAMLAVCQPVAVEKYKSSGNAADLYLSGMAGFVVVDKVDINREIISLLSPCAGSLPSNKLLMGDIMWME